MIKENTNGNRHRKFEPSLETISIITTNSSLAHTQDKRSNKYGKFEPIPYVTQPHDSNNSRKIQAH